MTGYCSVCGKVCAIGGFTCYADGEQHCSAICLSIHIGDCHDPCYICGEDIGEANAAEVVVPHVPGGVRIHAGCIRKEHTIA